MYRAFPFLVILGTVPGCIWSVRAYRSSEVICLMSLFTFSSVVTVCLDQVSIALACCLKECSTIWQTMLRIRVAGQISALKELIFY